MGAVTQSRSATAPLPSRGGAFDAITLGTGNHDINVLSGDIITIGAGTDSFVFDRKVGSHNSSMIAGFDAKHDTIDISKNVFGVTSFADLTISQTSGSANTVITNAGHAATAARLSITL